MDQKTLVSITIGTLSSLLLSYFIYKKVVVQESEDTKKRRHTRELRKALRSAKLSRDKNHERIVGANQGLRDQTIQQDYKRRRVLSPDASGYQNKPITLKNQLKQRQFEKDLINAQTGTKTIYFDNDDMMYTEEEILNGSVQGSHSLTKLKVKVPEQERQRLREVQNQAKVHRLQEFLTRINSNKSNYFNDRLKLSKSGGGGGSSKPLGKAQSQKARRVGMGSHLSTSSGDIHSLGVLSNPNIKLEPRHFKSKEGSVWLNMFESISNNYCLSNQGKNQMSANRSRQSRFAPASSQNPSKSRRINSNSAEDKGLFLQRQQLKESRVAKGEQQKSRLKRSNSSGNLARQYE